MRRLLAHSNSTKRRRAKQKFFQSLGHDCLEPDLSKALKKCGEEKKKKLVRPSHNVETLQIERRFNSSYGIKKERIYLETILCIFSTMMSYSGQHYVQRTEAAVRSLKVEKKIEENHHLRL